MPAHRLPWVKLWCESLDHEKVSLLQDGEYRTWIHLLLRGSQQPTRWRFASVQHAAVVAGRPTKHVETLLRVGLLEERPDGVWVHDAPAWQEVYPSDYGPGSSESAPRTLRGHSGNAPSINKEDSANAPGTLPEDSPNIAGNLAGEGRGERGERERESFSSANAEEPRAAEPARKPASVPRTPAVPSPPAVPPEQLDAMHAVLVGLRGYEPSLAWFGKVAEKYGHLDLEEEALKMRDWLAKAKKRECSTGFVLNWLKHAAEQEAAPPIAALSVSGRNSHGNQGNPGNQSSYGRPAAAKATVLDLMKAATERERSDRGDQDQDRSFEARRLTAS